MSDRPYAAMRWRTAQGIRFVAVDHADARHDNASPEEAERIASIICDLLEGRGEWTDREGIEGPITPADILVITPYNAQRKLIDAALAERGPAAQRSR